MDRVNLASVGFKRSKEDDFTDDGAIFTCYKVGSIRVSKSKYADQIYIAGHIIRDELPYKVYSALPHYDALDRLNGYPLADLTEDDLRKLYNDCLEFEKEYEACLANFKFPTLDEIKAALTKENDFHKKDRSQIIDLLNRKTALEMLELDSRSIKYDLDYINNYYILSDADIVEKANKVLNTAESIDIIERVPSHCYTYESLLEKLTK